MLTFDFIIIADNIHNNRLSFNFLYCFSRFSAIFFQKDIIQNNLHNLFNKFTKKSHKKFGYSKQSKKIIINIILFEEKKK